MSFRFWRRIRIAPGVTLNLSKSTASLSFGPRGAKYTVSPRGNRVTAGLPGTGLFYTVHEPSRASVANAPRVAQRDRLTLGFFQRLFAPADERALVDGLKALNAGDEGAAVLMEGDFAMTEAQRSDCPIRDCSRDDAPSKAELLPPVEIRAAAARVIAESGKMPREDLFVAAARILGFAKTGKDLKDKIDWSLLEGQA